MGKGRGQRSGEKRTLLKKRKRGRTRKIEEDIEEENGR